MAQDVQYPRYYFDAAWTLRRRCPSACGRWDLWNHGLCRRPANTRDWDSHGVGRRTKRCTETIDSSGDITHRRRLGFGLAGAAALTRFLSSELWEVKATDPVTFGAVSLLLVAVALAACVVPAQRAIRVDPTIALRYE